MLQPFFNFTAPSVFCFFETKQGFLENSILILIRAVLWTRLFRFFTTYYDNQQMPQRKNLDLED